MLEKQLGAEAMAVLKKAGNAWSYTTNLRKLFEDRVESDANHLIGAVVAQLRKIKSGLSTY